MAQPTPYTRQYIYEDEQSDNPLQPVAGAHMDTEFDAIKITVDETLENLALIQRDDGALKNGIVTIASLATDTAALITAGDVRGTWVTATAYVIGDIVEHGAIAYLAILDHTSGVFATDLAALKWVILTGTAVPDDSVSTIKIQDDAVTEDKILDGAVTVNKIGVSVIDESRLQDEAVTNAKLSDITGFRIKGQVVASPPAAPVDLTQSQALAGLLAFAEPGHRLSATGSSVPTTDQTAITSIRWTPHKHNLTPLYDTATSRWGNYAVAEISLNLDSNSGHSFYHEINTNFDLFVDYNAGTPRLVASRPWASATARHALGGISREATYGRYVNTSTTTVRFGTGSSDTVSKAAGALLHVGTFRTTGVAGQTEDSAAKRFLWNTYNRVPREVRAALETTDSWPYATATIRQANANAANQIDLVRGLDEDVVEVQASARWANDTLAGAGITLIGLDSTTAAAAGCIMVGASAGVANQILFSTASWVGLPGVGRHVLVWLERGNATGTQTWSGDGANPTFVQSGISGWVTA